MTVNEADSGDLPLLLLLLLMSLGEGAWRQGRANAGTDGHWSEERGKESRIGSYTVNT